MNKSARSLLQLALAYVAFTVWFSLFGASYVSLLTGVVRWGFEVATPRIMVQSVVVRGELLTITFMRLSDLAAHHTRVTTLSGGIQLFYTPPIVALSVMMAWPGRSFARRLFACVLALPLLALLPAVQFPPLVLAPELGGKLAHTWLWWWMFFASNGGAQVLALLFAWLATRASDPLSSRIVSWTRGPVEPLAASANAAPVPALGRASTRGSNPRKRASQNR